MDEPAIQTSAERQNALKRQTILFWEDIRRRHVPRPEAQERYINELLPLEMAFAGEHRRLPDVTQFPAGRCERLILLVGFSVEPLLQAIWAYRPTEIVPVLNASYGARTGIQMREELEDGVEHLKRRGHLEGNVRFRRSSPLGSDDPATVFRFLLREVGTDVRDHFTVIDITGGKKSMVSGAFFFAAYTNAAISYVDFDEYDEGERRPYGYTCLIAPISNPYREFRLRDWASVQRAYEHYQFATARETVEELLLVMRQTQYFARREIVAAQALVDLLRLYEEWDNGDYRAAAAMVPNVPDALREHLPTALSALGAEWPHARGVKPAETLRETYRALELGDVGEQTTFYCRLDMLTAYVTDEIARICRLLRLKEDFRSAFIRCDGLIELLLTARLFILWKCDGLLIDVEGAEKRLSDLSADERAALYTRLTWAGSDPERLAAALGGNRGHLAVRCAGDVLGSPADVREETAGGKVETPAGDKMEKNAEVGVRAASRTLDKFWRGSQLGHLGVLRTLRNKAAHAYAPIPRVLAEQALELVALSWTDFIREWMPKLDQDFTIGTRTVTAVSWSMLCGACGIDFLPPYRSEEG